MVHSMIIEFIISMLIYVGYKEVKQTQRSREKIAALKKKSKNLKIDSVNMLISYTLEFDS